MYSTVLYFGRNDLHQQVPDLPFDVGSENGPRPDEMEEIPGAISMFRFLPFEWLQVVYFPVKKRERRKKEKERRKKAEGKNSLSLPFLSGVLMTEQAFSTNGRN